MGELSERDDLQGFLLFFSLIYKEIILAREDKAKPHITEGFGVMEKKMEKWGRVYIRNTK